MAFAETRTDRRVLDAACKFDVTLSEAVKAGDCLGISSGTWVLSAHATAEQPIAVALSTAASGEIIQAALTAVVECVTTATNVATLGEKVAVADDGSYAAAAATTPDVGFVSFVGSDSLTAIVFLNPTAAQLTVVRA